MAETSRRWSPYVYGNDNPLRFIDPDGRETTAYGGFTSSAEMAARHEAAAEQFVERFQGNQKDRDKNKKAATEEKGKEKTDLQSRLKEAGWKEGQPMPAVDGVDPDYTVESLIIPVTRPIELLLRPFIALHWAKFLSKLPSNTNYVNLASPSRTAHIIAGDLTGGGHAWFGSLNGFLNGITGAKSMFPPTWSNGKIMHAISNVATSNPWTQQTGRLGSTFTKSGQPVRFSVDGVYEGVKIRVITTQMDIITAFPIK